MTTHNKVLTAYSDLITKCIAIWPGENDGDADMRAMFYKDYADGVEAILEIINLKRADKYLDMDTAAREQVYTAFENTIGDVFITNAKLGV